MKKWMRCGLLLSCLAAFSACSNEVNVIGEWKEIPVVYGILKPADSLNFIRIEKAYLDPRVSALVVAQMPDSIYYPEQEIDVLLLRRVASPSPFQVVDTLRRVDLAQRGIPRDSGIFASRPNYAYEITRKIDFNVDYRVEIHNKRTGKVFHSEMRTPGVGAERGNELYVDYFLSTPTEARAVRWSYPNPGTNADEFNDIKFQWRAPLFCNIFDIGMIIEYAEFQVDVNAVGEPEISGTRQVKTLEWKPIQNYLPEGSLTQVNINGENFYRFLARSLSPVTGTNIRRCLGDMDVYINAGGSDLAEYIKARNANDGLISGLNPAVPYSNISEGFGVFSATVRTWKRNISFDPDVYNFLNRSELTSNLGFKTIPCQ